jgi:hypothetical protein
MSETEKKIVIDDPLIQRNYNLLGHYLRFLIDSGLDFLKRQYIEENSETEFQRFSAVNFFNFILKDYIRKTVKKQVKTILEASLKCIDHLKDGIVDPDYLDKIVEQKLPQYQRYDLTILNTSQLHPNHQEIRIISKLTFRIGILQATRILACDDEKTKTYGGLVKWALPTLEESQHSLNSLYSIIDEMIDCFERNLDIINIPFYKPTFTIRNFQFVRRLYEHAQTIIDNELVQIYKEK